MDQSSAHTLMGSGASKHHQNTDIPTFKTQESPLTQRNMAKPQSQPFQAQSVGTQDQGDRKDINVTQGNIEWKVLNNETLKRYKLNHPEQAESLQKIFDWIQALANFVNGNLHQDNEYTSVREMVDGLANTSYDAYKSAETPEADKFIALVDFTIDIEGTGVLQKFAQHCFKDYHEFKDVSDKKTGDFICFDCLKKVLGTIQWFSDFHQSFCLSCTTAGVIPMCLKNVKRIDAESLNWKNGDEETARLIYRCVGILHNIARRLRDREFFANSEETLLHFAKVKVTSVAVASLLCLAYLVDEETNHLILADENLLSLIITMLNEACQSDDRRYSGFSSKELAEGLSNLAINDTNKKVLGNKGAVHLLVSMLKTSKDDEERAIAAKALWMLAFDEDNKKAIRQEKGALETLCELQQSEDQEVQKAAAGALWELEGKAVSNSKSEPSMNHVMISYQWDNQEVLTEVKNRLQESGYRVWMDLEQMGGSTLEAMAKAVENASVVLVCVSQRYKESPNCRSEAEYAYQLRKDIIPLMMQRKYKADGWLGMIVGTKLWIDFQSKHVIEASVGKLVKELGGRGKDVDIAELVVRPVEAVAVASPPLAPVVSGWTNKEVRQWLREIGLGKVCNEDISEINGETLIDLQQLRGECPEYFYRCLEQNLKLTNMVDIFKFRKALNKLLGY